TAGWCGERGELGAVQGVRRARWRRQHWHWRSLDSRRRSTWLTISPRRCLVNLVDYLSAPWLEASWPRCPRTLAGAVTMNTVTSSVGAGTLTSSSRRKTVSHAWMTCCRTGNASCDADGRTHSGLSNRRERSTPRSSESRSVICPPGKRVLQH